MSKDLHALQIAILNKLLFNSKLKYSELRPSEEVENNKLNFHLNQLQDLELIVKTEDSYSLTNKGKEHAGRLDTMDMKFKPQAKISAWICPVRKHTDRDWEFLVYTRLKHPFYGCQGFISGKVQLGETVIQAAARELEEECGLTGEPQVMLLRHYRVFDKTTNALLEDKFMFMCLVEDPTGELIPENEEGKYAWVAESDLPNYVTNHFESWEVFQNEVNAIKAFDGTMHFYETDHWSEKF